MINIKGIKYYTFDDLQEKAKLLLKISYPFRNDFCKREIGCAIKKLRYTKVRKHIKDKYYYFYINNNDKQIIL